MDELHNQFLGISRLIGPQFLEECVSKVGQTKAENWLSVGLIFLYQSETFNKVHRFISEGNSILFFHDIDFMQYTDSGVLSSFFPC